MKSTVIFADQTQTNPEEQPSHLLQKGEKIELTKEEYKQVIKEAYKEGAQEALTTQEKKMDTGTRQSLKDEGTQAAVKSEAQKKEETKQKLKAISNRHDIELLRAKTVFPFTLFPDTLIIDTTKVTLIRKQLFATEHITTIPLKDIADATVQTALFLATLTVQYMPQSNSPGMLQPVVEIISSLERQDAIKAKNILKGALVAKAEDIDIAQLNPEEVHTIIEKFGSNDGVS